MERKVGFPRTGAGYTAKIEHEYMHTYKLSVCNNCFALGFQRQLRRCTGCKIVDYCSKECQKAHWKKHKGFCNMAQGKSTKATYLSGYQPEEMYKVLIDAYRLRTELDHGRKHENHGRHYDGKLDDSLVWANGDVMDDFQRYLDLAEKAEVLPDWWRFETRMECLAIAVNKDGAESIFNQINQEELVTKYGGDTAIHSALCILAELIVGYEGKGPAADDEWFRGFQKYLNEHPDERARLVQGTIEAVKRGLEDMGQDVPDALVSFNP